MLFPALYASVDWGRGFRSLDKELALLGGARSGRGGGARSGRGGNKGTLIVDKLLSVYGRDGEDMRVLVHVEIQARKQDDFARRMYEYHARLFSKHRKPVVSLAVLADSDMAWRPSEYEFRFGGCRIRLDYPVAKLLDFQGRDDELLASSNRFAIVVFAYLKAKESEGDHELMYAWKLELMKRLSTKTEAEQSGLVQFFDAIFPTYGDLDEHFWHTFSTSEEGRSMAYVTGLERISIKKGLEKGRLESAQESILEALEVRFGPVSPELRSRIGNVSDIEECKKLHRRAIAAATLEDFSEGIGPRTS